MTDYPEFFATAFDDSQSPSVAGPSVENDYWDVFSGAFGGWNGQDTFGEMNDALLGPQEGLDRYQLLLRD